jgi:hypothetical protein
MRVGFSLLSATQCAEQQKCKLHVTIPTRECIETESGNFVKGMRHSTNIMFNKGHSPTFYLHKRLQASEDVCKELNS